MLVDKKRLRRYGKLEEVAELSMVYWIRKRVWGVCVFMK